MSKLKPKLLIEAYFDDGKLIVSYKLDNFKKRDTNEQKVLRAFVAKTSETLRGFDKDSK